MNRIKECRKKRDLIQTDLASRLGLTQSGLSLWETGKVDPGQEGWLKLSDILNVSVDYLMGKPSISATDSLQLFAEPSENNQPPKSEYKDEHITEILTIMESLPTKSKDEAINYLRYLASKEET